MKRILGILVAIVVLTGAAFTTQLLGNMPPPAKVPAGAAGYIAAWIADLQMNGLPLPEPVSIMLSSVILLGSTTLLRRRRTSRRA